MTREEATEYIKKRDDLKDCPSVKLVGDIIITDPCYFIHNSEGDPEEIFFDHKMQGFIKPTIYGDWGCTVFKRKSDEDLDAILEYLNNLPPTIDENEEMLYQGVLGTCKELGKFTADGGLVSVALLDEVLTYFPNFKEFMEKSPWCYCVIEGFNGTVEYQVIGKGDNKYCRLLGYGNIPFFTEQTSL